jgi:excisionase family DNA binding protein
MLISLTEASRELGVSTKHIRDMVKLGKWPAYRVGVKALRIDPQEIRDLARLISQAEHSVREDI